MQTEFWKSTGQTQSDSATSAQSDPTTCPSLTSSAAGSHARISVLQARVRASMAHALDSGASLPESLARFDPESSSWKMSQRCLVEGLDRFSEIWPRSGMMRSGIAYPLLPSAPVTDGTECLSWGTPRASLGRGNPMKRAARGMIEGQVILASWPTPTVNGNNNHKGASQKAGDGLATVVKAWPTPTARDWRSGKASPETMERNARPLNEVAALGEPSASLNPSWVESLMGFPPGWSEVSPLAPVSPKKTGKRRESRKESTSEPTACDVSGMPSCPRSPT